jgi:large subunit ribosomal protein L2
MAKYQLLTKKEPEKSLILDIKEDAGRNNLGRITSRHKGGGVKRLYRIIDFGQKKLGIPAKVIALEYDPYRTAFIMLLEYKDGDRRYQIAPYGIEVGQEVLCDQKTDIVVGNRMKLKNIPVGTLVYNIEIIPNKGGQLARSAGSYAKLLAHEGKYVHLQMPSGEVRKVLQECFASVGQVSHPENRFEKNKKAGFSRRKGRRPHVRGSAMTPVSHPHGGGEGKTPIGMKYPKTPWGKPARGVKTRKRIWTDKFIIKKRK